MKVNVLVIDFMGKMGSLGKHEDDLIVYPMYT